MSLALNNRTEPPVLNQLHLFTHHPLRRVLTLGFYSAHLSHWLIHFPSSQMRVQWVEHFKADPFQTLWAIESYLGLPHHDFRKQVRAVLTGPLSDISAGGGLREIFHRRRGVCVI